MAEPVSVLGSVVSVFGDAVDCEKSLEEFGCAGFLVLAKGKFTARMTKLSLHSVRLLRLQETLPRIAMYSCPPGMRRFILPAAAGRISCNGVEALLGTLVTHGSGARVFERCSPPSDTQTILIPERMLLRKARRLSKSAYDLPPGVLSWQPGAEDLKHLSSLHSAGTRMSVARLALAHDEDAYRGLEQQLTEALVECLERVRSTDILASSARISCLIRRFEVQSALPGDRPKSLGKVCGELGVSPSTLRRHCFQQLGISPRQYISLQSRHIRTVDG